MEPSGSKIPKTTVDCICACRGKGLKSSITPTLGGDSKTSQNTFLLEPVSIENLHNNKGTRISGVGLWGRASGQYADHLHSRRPTDLQVIRMKVSLRQV